MVYTQETSSIAHMYTIKPTVVFSFSLPSPSHTEPYPDNIGGYTGKVLTVNFEILFGTREAERRNTELQIQRESNHRVKGSITRTRVTGDKETNTEKNEP